MAVSVYLTFDGTCEEAFKTYAALMDGKIVAMMRYEGSPAETMMPPEYRDRALHATLSIGDTLVMGSDRPPGQYTAPAGMNASLSVATAQKAESIFAGLSEGGEVVMPLTETFWAERFGMVTDRFGTPWMINCDKPR